MCSDPVVLSFVEFNSEARQGRAGGYTCKAALIMTRPSSQREPWSGHLFDSKREREVY